MKRDLNYNIHSAKQAVRDYWTHMYEYPESTGKDRMNRLIFLLSLKKR